MIAYAVTGAAVGLGYTLMGMDRTLLAALGAELMADAKRSMAVLRAGVARIRR